VKLIKYAIGSITSQDKSHLSVCENIKTTTTTTTLQQSQCTYQINRAITMPCMVTAAITAVVQRLPLRNAIASSCVCEEKLEIHEKQKRKQTTNSLPLLSWPPLFPIFNHNQMLKQNQLKTKNKNILCL
jgi:hypothetical protein